MLNDTTARRAKPYRVTLTFILDNPADNLCESQRSKVAGSTYSWAVDFATSKAAMQHIQNALAPWMFGRRRGRSAVADLHQI